MNYPSTLCKAYFELTALTDASSAYNFRVLRDARLLRFCWRYYPVIYGKIYYLNVKIVTSVCSSSFMVSLVFVIEGMFVYFIKNR